MFLLYRYIKELAERLNALEGQIHPHHGHQTTAELQFLQQSLAEAAAASAAASSGGSGAAPRRESDMHPSYASTPDHAGRKRTHSQSEGLVDAPQSAHRPVPYGNVYTDTPRPAAYLNAAPVVHAPPAPIHTPAENRIEPAHLSSAQPFFKFGADVRRQESVSIPFDSESAHGAAALIDWDEEVIDEYVYPLHARRT